MVAELLNRRETRPERVETQRVYTPAVDIVESKDGWVMLVDMAGVEPKNIDIQYENGLLTIHGKVENAERAGAFLRCEYGTGDYHRVFTLGEGIDAAKIQAEFKDGVMMLHLPKSETLKPRRIEVKPG